MGVTAGGWVSWWSGWCYITGLRNTQNKLVGDPKTSPPTTLLVVDGSWKVGATDATRERIREGGQSEGEQQLHVSVRCFEGEARTRRGVGAED